MSIFHAIVLGIVQGLGEFLPISSSAHLVLFPWLFKWPDPGLTFDVALHIGTLFAVIAYFWKDWVVLISHGVKGTKTNEGKLFWFIVISAVPGAIIGKLFEGKVESAFHSNDPTMMLFIGISLIIMGVVLYAGDVFGRKKVEMESVTFKQALTIGFSQALAIIPGVSRSGITMTTGLFLGLTRETVARFSFLMSTPIIFGAGILKLKDIGAADLTTAFFTGVGTSAIVGFLSIAFMLKYIKTNSFLPFTVYRFILGLIVIVTFILRY